VQRCRCSEENCLIGKKYFADIKTSELHNSGRLSKALGAALRNLLSNRCKGFELAAFEKLLANSIAFHTKRLRIY
jgi:hypothetical protein